MLRTARRAKRAIRLTELSVRKARPAKAAYLIWDTQQRSLALQVQPTGAKAWKCIYSRRGRPRWLTLGPADVIALGDARTLAAEAMLKVAKGGDPAADKKAERTTGTFAELASQYVEQYAKKHNKSWRQADALVRRLALPRWGKLQASSITRGDIKALMAKITAPVVANQTKAAISAMFTWGVKEEIVAANPCKLVESNPTRDRERVLSASELPRFGQELAALDDPVAATTLKVILLTGQRPGEVVNMRREHIKDGWWEMPGAPIADIWPGTKNAQSHRIWLPKSVQQLLGKDDVATGFVFPGARGKSAVHRLADAMRVISKQLAGGRATPHDLRRTHGSTITAMGFGRPAMHRVQNHKEGGIGDIYDRHDYGAENTRIMEAVADRIMALVEGRGSDKVVKFVR